jgi:16S rRNA (adenine1518-N6/adenine1519-N6)-dimethyltransferase
VSARAHVRDMLARHELRLKKSLGQSFLVDDNILAAIAEEATRDDPEVLVEIGTGLGTLTRELATRAKNVVTIERDRTLIPVLREIFPATSNVRVVEGDALELRYNELTAPIKPALAGNLPYSITTPLLLCLLEQRHLIGSATIMIQREVADRLHAEVDTRDYGSLTLLFQMHTNIERLFDVSPSCFIPPPKVVSTVLRLEWLPCPRVQVEDPAHLEVVVRAAFSQRRKTLRNSLSTKFAKPDIERAAEAANIKLERRAETLTLSEFSALASHLPRAAEPNSATDR